MAPINRDHLVASFCATWQSLGLGGDPAPLAAVLLRAWDEPHRRYHDLGHLAHGLKLLVALRAQLERPAEAELAWWFHDVIYNPRAGDNEARSAAWADRALAQGGADRPLRARVKAMIDATVHGGGTDATGDTALFLDVDLSILGADPQTFAAYEEGVRFEYQHVPEMLWRIGRRKVLVGFAERPRIFLTPGFAEYEARARENLRRALAGLG